MILSELQAVRSALYAKILAAEGIDVQSYTINGRSLFKGNIDKMYERLGGLDLAIARMNGGAGGCPVAKIRRMD